VPSHVARDGGAIHRSFTPAFSYVLHAPCWVSSDLKSLHPLIQEELTPDDGQEAGAGGVALRYATPHQLLDMEEHDPAELKLLFRVEILPKVGERCRAKVLLRSTRKAGRMTL
jgi:hypothetical protein